MSRKSRCSGLAESLGTTEKISADAPIEYSLEMAARGSATEKLASRVVREIRNDIIDRAWPVGVSLGGEPELLERYQVSRAVFREAVRLLEYSGVVEMRRGPSGGLYVAERPSAAAVNVIVSYLDAVDVDIEEIYDARDILEPLATQLAIDRVGESGAQVLRAALDQELARETDRDPLPNLLHFAIADCSGNPALALTIRALCIASGERVPLRSRGGRTDARELHRAHHLIVDAILAGDAAAAGRRTQTHLRALRKWHLENRSTSPEPLHEAWNKARSSEAKEPKLPARLARFIRSEIRQQRFAEGSVIGSEADFLERYDVSRGAFREAVRILEYLGVAEMRRGPGGGLVVRRPTLERAAAEIADYLRFLDLDAAELHEVRKAAELGCVPLMMERLDDDGRRRIAETIGVEERSASDQYNLVGHELHRLLAELSGNRPLLFIADVFTRLTRSHNRAVSSPDADQIVEATRHAHARIADAILDGDESLAMLRMRRHLDAVMPFLRSGRDDNGSASINRPHEAVE